MTESMPDSQMVMAMLRLARPPFRNNHDKVTFAIHASFMASGYILAATGRPAFAENALYSLSQSDVGIDGWNEFDGEYAFLYGHPKKGVKKILVKCLVIDDKLLVDAIVAGRVEPTHLEIKVENYAQRSNEENYAAQFKNLDKLLSDLHSEIFNKLDPKLKPVSSEAQSSSETNEEPRHDVDMPGPSGSPQIHPSGSGGCVCDENIFVGPSDPHFLPFDDGAHLPDCSRGPPQPGMLPPGARYDPYDIHGSELGRSTRQPPRRPARR